MVCRGDAAGCYGVNDLMLSLPINRPFSHQVDHNKAAAPLMRSPRIFRAKYGFLKLRS